MNKIRDVLEIQEILKGLTTFKVFKEDSENIPIKNGVLVSHGVIEGAINLLISRYFFDEKSEKSEKNKVNYFWINILGNINFMRKLEILKELNILSNKKNVPGTFRGQALLGDRHPNRREK